MPYIVYQSQGKLNELANEYHVARKAGDMDKVVSIYRQATGDTRDIGDTYSTLPVLESCWWIYNAPDIIRQAHGIESKEVYRYLGIKQYPTDQVYCKAVLALARQRHGGKWEMYWEY